MVSGTTPMGATDSSHTAATITDAAPLRFTSEDLATGEFFPLAECPTYGEFTAICRAADGDEFEFTARFPVETIALDVFTPVQQGYDVAESPHGPPVATDGCKCKFRSKWVKKRNFMKRNKRTKVKRNGNYVTRIYGTNPFDWWDRTSGRHKTNHGQLALESKKPIVSAGVYRVWANGPRDRCQSTFEIDANLSVETTIQLSRTSSGLAKSWVEAGGTLAFDSTIGGPLVCPGGLLSRFNFPGDQNNDDRLVVFLYAEFNNAGTAKLVEWQHPLISKPVSDRSVSAANNKVGNYGPVQTRKVEVSVSVSSLSQAQLAGRKPPDDQTCFGKFTVDEFSVKIKGRWLATECVTEDFDVELFGSEPPDVD